MQLLKKLINRFKSEKRYVVFATYQDEDEFSDDFVVTKSFEEAQQVYKECLTNDKTYCAGISKLIKGTDWP